MSGATAVVQPDLISLLALRQRAIRFWLAAIGLVAFGPATSARSHSRSARLPSPLPSCFPRSSFPPSPSPPSPSPRFARLPSFQLFRTTPARQRPAHALRHPIVTGHGRPSAPDTTARKSRIVNLPVVKSNYSQPDDDDLRLDDDEGEDRSVREGAGRRGQRQLRARDARRARARAAAAVDPQRPPRLRAAARLRPGRRGDCGSRHERRRRSARRASREARRSRPSTPRTTPTWTCGATSTSTTTRSSSPRSRPRAAGRDSPRPQSLLFVCLWWRFERDVRRGRG